MHTAQDHRVHRFSFSDFGAPPPPPVPVATVPEIPAEPPPPLITQEDVDAAGKAGYDKGYQDGYGVAEAKFDKEQAAREELLAGLLGTLANRVTLSAEMHREELKAQQTFMVKVALAAAKKLAGDAIKREPLASVEGLLAECQALIVGQEEAVIAVSPRLAPLLTQRLDSIRPQLAEFKGKLTIKEDISLSDQDCRVEWRGGYAEHDQAKLWSDIEALIARAGGKE